MTTKAKREKKPFQIVARIEGEFDPWSKTQFEKGNQRSYVDRRAYTLFESDDRLSYTVAQLHRCRHRNGKTYARWEQLTAHSIRKTPSGKLVTTSSHGSGKKKKWDSGYAIWERIVEGPTWGIFNNEVGKQFLYLVKEKFGVSSFKDEYPMASHFKIDSYTGIPCGLKDAFRAKDAMEFAKLAFAKKYLRKDLVKALAKADPKQVSFARQFRGLVPIDWIIAALNSEHGVWSYHANPEGLRKLLKQFDQRTLRNLLTVHRGTPEYMMHDSVRLANLEDDRLAGQRFRDWHEVHDCLSGQGAFRRQQAERTARLRKEAEEIQIKQTKIAKAIDGQVAGEMVIYTAKTGGDMYQWSDLMSNCISGYVDTAARGYGVYAAVLKDEKVYANIEIKPGGQLGQLLGKYNQPLPQEEREAIEGVLVDQGGVEIPDVYWGRN